MIIKLNFRKSVLNFQITWGLSSPSAEFIYAKYIFFRLPYVIFVTKLDGSLLFSDCMVAMECRQQAVACNFAAI
jgi:hypothetical protein